jgi:hypothetical protein
VSADAQGLGTAAGFVALTAAGCWLAAGPLARWLQARNDRPAPPRPEPPHVRIVDELDLTWRRRP